MQNEKRITEWAEEFILYKQGIGYVYYTQQFYLRNYVRFIEEKLMGAVFPTNIAQKKIRAPNRTAK